MQFELLLEAHLEETNELFTRCDGEGGGESGDL